MVSSPGSKSPNQRAPDLRSQAVANYTIIKGGTSGGIRTHTLLFLRQLPLPLGYTSINGPPHGIRTRT